MKSRIADEAMIAAANPPAGYVPIVSNSNFGWENGPIFEYKDKNLLKRGFRVAERHINAGGSCHGGMIMTFADILMASAVMQYADPPFVTVRLTTDFIGPSLLGDWLEGTAEVTVPEDGLIAVSGIIQNNKRVVAGCSGLFKVFVKSKTS